MQENEENTGSEKVLILPLSEDSKKITQVLSNDKAMKVMEILADTPMSASDVAEKMGMPLTTIKYNIDALVEADLIKVKQTKWSKKGREIKIYEPVQKIIVVAPGGMKGDKSSILSMLKKYLVMIGGAIFAATGLEVLTNYMGFGAAPMAVSTMTSESQDAIAPLVNEALPEVSPERAFIPEALNQSSVPTDGEMIAYDITEKGLSNNTGMESMSSPVANQTLDGAGNIASDGLNSSMVNQAPVASDSHMVAENASTLSHPLSSIIPHDILSHVSIWFLFGCLFVIALLFIREIYYRKKEI